MKSAHLVILAALAALAFAHGCWRVAVWYGLWRGRDRDRNGLHRWEWTLLEIRGWQVIFGRESWRDLADLMNQRPNMPTLSYEGWRRHHAQLIEIALNQAIKAHDIQLAEHATPCHTTTC